jgi:hypothetical protein
MLENLLEIPNLVDVNKIVIHKPFPPPCLKRNASLQDISF